MDMTKIKEKAKQLGIQVGKMKKVDLIRAIQSKEGLRDSARKALAKFS